MSAEREQGGRRALARRPRAVMASLLGAALALGAAPMPDSPAAGTTTVSSSALQLLAAPATTGIVRPGQSFSMRVTVSNTGSAPSGALTIDLAVDGGRLADASTLAAWFDGETVEMETRSVAQASLSPLDAGASAVLDLIVPGSAGVVGGDFGARLAVVTASGAAGEVLAADRSALVWLPENAAVPRAATTFIAPLTTPGEQDALLSAATLEEVTAPAGALTRTLDAVTGRPALLAIDPRVIASIRALGEDAPASATAFLERLAGVPNESFMLPWADADAVATLVAAGTPLPPPEGIGAPLDRSGDDGGQTAQPAPAPSPDSPLSIEELAAWPTTFTGWTWPGADSLTAAALEGLAEQGNAVVFASHGSLGSSAAVQRIGSQRLLLVDEALALAAREASLAASQQRFDRAMARVSALLSSIASRSPGSPAVIPLAREQLAGADRLHDTIVQTIMLPWAVAGTASAALDLPAAPATVIDAAADPARVAAVAAVLEAEQEDRRFAQIALTPERITDLRRLELLTALSLGWGERSADALTGFLASSTALRSSVQVVESSAITLLTDRASLPVTVQSSLDIPVRVFVRVAPNSGQLRVLDARVETLVEPHSQTRALVPVESLTNGEVVITVTIQDAEGRLVGEPTRVALNLQAGWETLGTVVVAIAIALLFAFGIVRDIRKRRRERREQES